MVDRGKLPRLNKRYELDHSDRSGKEFHSGAFRYALPWASLPVFMEETQPGGGSSLTLDIADDVEGAKADGGLESIASLDLGFDNLNEDDELDVRINGEAVAWSSMERSEDGWGYTAFDGDRVPHDDV